jgi:hypothetical protein
MQDKPLCDQNVGVSWAMSRHRIIGAICLDDTINSGQCCEAILYPFVVSLNEGEIVRRCFQQGGATAHVTRVSMALLSDVFGDGIIPKSIWPPRSPDLTPPDYYLWAPTKGAVYKDGPYTLLVLKQAVANLITNITLLNCRMSLRTKIRRVNACLQARGGYFNISCNANMYEKCICINVQEHYEYTHRPR